MQSYNILMTYSATGSGISVLILLSSIGLYMSRDQWAADIVLTAKEKSQLITTHHDWTRQYPEQLPDLTAELTPLKLYGIVLLGSHKTITDERLNNLQKQAKASWIRFAQRHQITVRWCTWDNIDKCQLAHPKRLFVILPSYWQQYKLGSLFNAGRSVLLYGEPFQTILLKNNENYGLYGMQFERFIDNSYSKLALVADRELSLGFDAGSILNVRTVSDRYQVTTTRPQAIAIDSSHHAGGAIKTRLYTQLIQKGRLLWMDFSPDISEHPSTLDNAKFNHLMASIFRYLNKQSYQSIAMWPEGRRFAALLVHDVREPLPAAERVRQFFQRNDYPITWSVLANDAQQHRALMRRLSMAGEVACVGDNALAFTLSDAQQQHERIAHCQKVLTEITGKKVTTFRPPEEKFIGDTLDAMTNNGIRHFIAEQGVDRFVPILIRSTLTAKELLSIPRMTRNDNELWGRLKADIRLTNKLTIDEMAYVEQVGGLYLFSFSTAFMLNDDHFTSMKQLADALYQRKAYFQTANMIAKWWQLRTKMIAGKAITVQETKRFRPVVLKVNNAGKLSSHWYRAK